MNCIIRQEEEKDFKQVHNVIRNAFYRADKEEDFNEWILVDKIRKSEFYIKELSLVAEYENEILGHIIYTPITIHSKDKVYNSLALGPIAVEPKYQNKGIGHELMKESKKKAKELGYGSIIVMGHPNYYRKFGFELASKWKIGIDENLDSKYLFALELIPGELDRINGIIRYCDVFYNENGELI